MGLGFSFHKQRKFWIGFVLLLVLGSGFVPGANWWVLHSTRDAIITDDFHLSRAVFLARSYGLDVVGFPSEHVGYWRSKKVRTREFASRTVAFLEVYGLHTQPRYYGPPLKIEVAARP